MWSGAAAPPGKTGFERTYLHDHLYVLRLSRCWSSSCMIALTSGIERLRGSRIKCIFSREDRRHCAKYNNWPCAIDHDFRVYCCRQICNATLPGLNTCIKGTPIIILHSTEAHLIEKRSASRASKERRRKRTRDDHFEEDRKTKKWRWWSIATSSSWLSLFPLHTVCTSPSSPALYLWVCCFIKIIHLRRGGELRTWADHKG